MKNYIRNKEEIVLYLVMGVLTTIINILIKNILLFTILNPKKAIDVQIAVIISWIVSILFAYITNKKYVFNSEKRDILKEFISFITARITTLIIEMFIMYFFITFLELNTNIWVFIWTLFSQAIVIVLNYIFSKYFVFNKKKC